MALLETKDAMALFMVSTTIMALVLSLCFDQGEGDTICLGTLISFFLWFYMSTKFDFGHCSFILQLIAESCQNVLLKTARIHVSRGGIQILQQFVLLKVVAAYTIVNGRVPACYLREVEPETFFAWSKNNLQRIGSRSDHHEPCTACGPINHKKWQK